MEIHHHGQTAVAANEEEDGIDKVMASEEYDAAHEKCDDILKSVQETLEKQIDDLKKEMAELKVQTGFDKSIWSLINGLRENRDNADLVQKLVDTEKRLQKARRTTKISTENIVKKPQKKVKCLSASSFPLQRNIDVCKQYEIVKAARFPNTWLDEMEALGIIVLLVAVIFVLLYRSCLIADI